MEGIIVKSIAGFCYVEAGNTIYESKPRGILRNVEQGPIAGDRVELDISGATPSVTKVYPRKNSLIRPPLANIDKLFIVSAQSLPKPNALLIDRLTVIAESKGIEPVLIFNKSDLGDFEPFLSAYDLAGIRYYKVSCKTGEGFSEILKNEFSSGISAFTGNSGVGKSSILNMLFSQLSLKTGEVSEKLGRGRHTTRHVELYKLGQDAYVADTPGFSSLDIERYEVILKDDLPFYFPEFSPYLGECKFTSCSHTKEKGCAVLQAVQEGKIGQSRLQSYVSLYNEVKDLKEWEYKKK